VGVPHRCRSYKCRTRRSLNKRIEDYKIKPSCVRCGGELARDKHRIETELKRLKDKSCYCGHVLNRKGEPYPHQPGSTPWCLEHPEGPSEAEYMERYGHV
jgi:hypothetical protein